MKEDRDLLRNYTFLVTVIWKEAVPEPGQGQQALPERPGIPPAPAAVCKLPSLLCALEPEGPLACLVCKEPRFQTLCYF